MTSRRIDNYGKGFSVMREMDKVMEKWKGLLLAEACPL